MFFRYSIYLAENSIRTHGVNDRVGRSESEVTELLRTYSEQNCWNISQQATSQTNRNSENLVFRDRSSGLWNDAKHCLLLLGLSQHRTFQVCRQNRDGINPLVSIRWVWKHKLPRRLYGRKFHRTKYPEYLPRRHRFTYVSFLIKKNKKSVTLL